MVNVKEILEEQKRYLEHYFETVDSHVLGQIIALCADVKGLLVITGVGKSGIIAEKIAMTLISTGTRALYLPAMNFLHGDIGILSEEDLLIMISRSGATEELLEILPFIQAKKTKTVAVVSIPSSQLQHLVDHTLVLPVEKELCPFDLAPTTSTAVQLLFGDLLAIALMKHKQFSLEEYARNHPAGSIGKKMHLTVGDIMFRNDAIPKCSPCDKLIDVLVELTNKKCGAILALSHGDNLEGIFTDGDLRRALQALGVGALDKKISELMTQKPLVVLQTDLASHALKRMQSHPKKLVAIAPVVEGSRVVGVLRMHDIIQAGIV